MKRTVLIALISIAGIVASAQTATQRAVVAASNALAGATGLQPKRLAAIRSSDAPEGSRVIITSDTTLGDYRSYVESGRFYLLIPHAIEPQAQNDLSGRGFTNVEIGRHGEDVLLSFGLEAGAQARVSQRFNRLEVMFVTASVSSADAGTNQISVTSQPTPAASPSPTPSATETKSPSTSTAASPQTSKAPTTAATMKGITLPPEKLNPVRINKFEKPPEIDGKLDDEAWKNATVFKNFYQTSPGDNIAPSKPTEVMIGYDARFLYLGFHCYDEPDKVRATVAKRDNILDTEDTVRVLLDTFNDQRK